MFASPLIGWFRLSAVLLLAAAIVLTGVTGTDAAARWTGVAGCLFLVAAVAGMVRGAGAFDERAFHRTRPGGERRVFLWQTLWLVSLPLAAGLIAVARAWWWNLGWRNAWTVGAVVFVLLLLPSATVATGVVLGAGRSGRKAMVAGLMIGLPVAVYVWLEEMGHWQAAALPQRFALWTNQPDSGVMIAAIGFCLAWCLAAGNRRWKAALAAALAAGLCLPMLAYRDASDSAAVVERMPKSATIQRMPLEKIASRKGGARKLGNWLNISGVRDDEILVLKVDASLPDGGRAWGGQSSRPFPTSICFSGRIGTGATCSMEEALTGCMPGDRVEIVNPILDGALGRVKMQYAEFWTSDLLPSDFGDMKRVGWRISWYAVRPVHVGSVPVATGGSIELPAGGVFKVDPVRLSESGCEITTFELCPSEGRRAMNLPVSMSGPNGLAAILVSGDGHKAVVLSLVPANHTAMSGGEGLGSRWLGKTIRLGWNTRIQPQWQTSGDSELARSDMENARIHVLDMRPGREEGIMVLPAIEP